MLEIGAEKMKVSDEQNRQAFRNIDPKQPFHGIRLTGRKCIGQELELITNSAVMLSEAKHLWSILVPRRSRFDLRFFASLRMTR